MNEDDRPIEGIERLPREFPVPAGLEDRVVAGLPRPNPTSRRLWVSLAAAIVVLATSWASFSAGRRSASATPAPSGDKYLLLLYGAAAAPDQEEARFIEYAAWARD